MFNTCKTIPRSFASVKQVHYNRDRTKDGGVVVKKKQRLKTETVGVRMSAKLRYGLELVARKHHATLSSLLVSAAEHLLKEEGLTERLPGKPYSLLDLLWSDDENNRKIALAMNAPELMARREVEVDRGVFFVGAILTAENRESLYTKLKSLPNYRDDMREILAKIEGGDKFIGNAMAQNKDLSAEFDSTKQLIEWLLSRDSEK